MIKYVIFDYDGVLVDSFSNIYNVYKKITKELGVPIPPTLEGFRKAYGYNYYECYKNLEIPKSMYDKAEIIFKTEILKQSPAIYKNIDKVLKELAINYKLVLLSYNYLNEVEQKLNKFDIYKYFNSVLAPREDQRISKVNLIKKLVKEKSLGINNVVYIGDRDIDFDICKEAGIENLILTNYGWGHSKKDYRFTVNEPGEIIGLVEVFNKVNEKTD